MVFDEPQEPKEGSFHGLADWYRNSGSPEARAARRDINAWYANFPDRNGMLLGNLRGGSDIGIQQATDELYVHHLLSSSYQAQYEEDAGSPDFRLYRSSEYVAGIEVRTLFLEKDVASKIARNAKLVYEINRRVRSVDWRVRIDIIDWKRQPRVTDVAAWLQGTVARLPAPAANLAREDYPSAIYPGVEAELRFGFIPRGKVTPASASGPIVAFGPSIAWFSRGRHRLRNYLSEKAGSKYDLRGRPFAVLISVRDSSCDIEDVINALYGDDAISFPIGDPDSAQRIRKRNGTFGCPASTPGGRNRRLSCVFALMRGWVPGSTEAPTMVRFDNPFAEQAFPDDALTPSLRFVPVSDELGIHMECEPSSPSW
jgi:hypothetical protein